MAFYPKIATLSYSDRNIKVKIPIRIKLIRMTKYYCPEHGEVFGIKNMLKWVSQNADRFNNKKIDLKFEYDENTRMQTPRFFVKSLHHVLCPSCYLEKEKQVVTQIQHNDLLKVYTSVAPDYVDVPNLVSDFIPMKWKRREGHQLKPRLKQRVSMEAYYEKLEEVYRRLGHWLERIADNKELLKIGCTVKIDIDKTIKIEELEKARDKYEQRKFVRKL